MRVYTAALGCLERIVPEDGMPVGDVFLPPGTAVGIQSYDTHRDPEVWDDPSGKSVVHKARFRSKHSFTAFKPERWFNETQEMKVCLMFLSPGAC